MDEMIKVGCQSHFLQTETARLHYWSLGEGDPIILLHGVPSQGQDWLSVMSVLSSLGKCLALDFPGFGASSSLNLAFDPDDQLTYLTDWIHALQLKNITFVLHGFGGAMGLNFILKNLKSCKAVVFYDTFLMDKNQQFSLPVQQQLFLADAMQNHYLHDKALCRTLMKQIVAESTESMSEEQVEDYVNHYLQSPQLPLALKAYFSALKSGSGFVDSILKNSQQLLETSLPKLLLYSIPGFVMDISMIEWAKQHVKRLEIMEVGDEWHFAHLIHGKRMGESISAWLQAVEQQHIRA